MKIQIDITGTKVALYKVTYENSKIVIENNVKTENIAIRNGRKNAREMHRSGQCASGFDVYKITGVEEKLIRKQRCNNFGENWKED